MPTTPSSDSTITFSTAPPSAKPRARNSATSRSNPKVRAPAISRPKLASSIVHSPRCLPITG